MIRIVGWLFVAILVGHIVLTLGDANPVNDITRFVAYWADRLLLGFQDLFTPADETVRVLVNYGLAALFWLVVSSVLARLVRRLGLTSRDADWVVRGSLPVPVTGCGTALGRRA